MSECIAVINAGSSSIKFAPNDAGRRQDLLFRGQIEQIGVSPRLYVANANGESVSELSWHPEGFDHRTATQEILKTALGLIRGARVLGVGHRVVHGGTEYAAPIRIDDQVMAAVSALKPLAPLHQPHNLSPIAAIMEAAPGIPQVACFDTAFHRSQSNLAQLFGLPRKLTEAGIR